MPSNIVRPLHQDHSKPAIEQYPSNLHRLDSSASLDGYSVTSLNDDATSKRPKRKAPFQNTHATPDQYTSEQLQNVPLKFKLQYSRVKENLSYRHKHGGDGHTSRHGSLESNGSEHERSVLHTETCASNKDEEPLLKKGEPLPPRSTKYLITKKKSSFVKIEENDTQAQASQKHKPT